MQPKVSIIVPIYGVEQYIHQCFETLFAQTLKEVEFILIDDGSKDRCPEIIDDYAKRDSRIVVKHLANGGYGRAINIGLSLAKGEYIGIVEPDDWIEPDMYATLYQAAITHQADVVKANFFHSAATYERITETSAQRFRALSGRLLSATTDPDIFQLQPSIWSAIYHRDFLEREAIRLLETPGASFQDTGFHFKVMATATRILLLERPLYHYRIDNASSSVKNPTKIYCVCDEWREIYRYLREKGLYECYACTLYRLQYNTYKWNWKRLSFRMKRLFLSAVAEEFNAYHQAGDLDILKSDKKVYKALRAIMRAPRWFAFKLELKRLLKRR